MTQNLDTVTMTAGIEAVKVAAKREGLTRGLLLGGSVALLGLVALSLLFPSPSNTSDSSCGCSA